MAEGDTLVNALVGAVIGAVLGFVVPFSPLLGGAISGYMEGGTRSDGLTVGAIAGVIAFIPAILIGGLIFLVITTLFLGTSAGDLVGLSVLGGAVIFLILAGIAVYIIGLSTAGGWIGNYIKYETGYEV